MQTLRLKAHPVTMQREHEIIANTNTRQFHRVRAWLTWEDVWSHFGRNTHVALTMIAGARMRVYGEAQYTIIEYYVVVRSIPFQ